MAFFTTLITYDNFVLESVMMAVCFFLAMLETMEVVLPCALHSVSEASILKITVIFRSTDT